MKKTIPFFSIHFAITCFLAFHTSVFAQTQLKVGQSIGSIQNTSVLELDSKTRGLLLPRLNNTEAAAMIPNAKTNSASGLLIYNTDCKCLQVFDASTTSGRWVTFWSTFGNSGTGTQTPTLGTTYEKDVSFVVNNVERLKLTTTGEADFKNQVIRNYSAKLQTITALTYTITSSDNGSILLIDTAEPHILSIPTGLPIGFTCTIIQQGLGSITISGASGLVVNQRGNSRTTNGQFAAIHLLQTEESSIFIQGDFE